MNLNGRDQNPGRVYRMGSLWQYPAPVAKSFSVICFNLEKKFWKVEEPFDFEIKGRLLLSRNGLTSPKKREFIEEILSLCKLNQVVAFAMGLRYPHTPTMQGWHKPKIPFPFRVSCLRAFPSHQHPPFFTVNRPSVYRWDGSRSGLICSHDNRLRYPLQTLN